LFEIVLLIHAKSKLQKIYLGKWKIFLKVKSLEMVLRKIQQCFSKNNLLQNHFGSHKGSKGHFLS